MNINRNYLIVGALCTAFAIAGALGGYRLSHQNNNVAEIKQNSDALASQNSFTEITAEDQQFPATLETGFSSGTYSQPLKHARAYDDKHKKVTNLVKTIHEIARQQNISMNLDTQIKTENEFINMIDDSPTMVQPLLDVYQGLSVEPTKSFLRSLLVTTGSPLISERAFQELDNGDIRFRSGWLEILRDTGVRGSQNRDKLLQLLPSLDQEHDVSNLILSISPEVASQDERFKVVSQLELYLHDNSDRVRSAAVKTLSNWGDENHSYVIEQALQDASERVRFSAISAAFTTSIRSDYIKSSLLEIMDNKNENMPLRIHAFNALSNYSLDHSSQQQYFEFHQQLTSYQGAGAAKG